MAGKGPPPTPTAVLRLRGSWRADERDGEPQPDSGIPQCPRRLSRRAQAYWQSTLVMLTEINVLTVVDGEALARYCILCAKFDIERDIDRMLRISVQIDKLSQQFGLTPSSRARIKVTPKEEKSAKRRFFGTSAG